ncbi:MAG: hypothetical protein M8867_01120 [marine benthic group bacterium]|nr:hypothetical protein [Gemmatimonadota bacterium]
MHPVRFGLLAAAICIIGVSFGMSRAPAGLDPTTGCLEETIARFEPVLAWHARHYTSLKARDVYKLLHQAVAGPGHAIRNPDMARGWLEREWDSLGMPLEGEQVLEPLSGDGRLVRLNLRPWRAAGRDQEQVFDAFLRTAEVIAPPGDSIRARMDEIRACQTTLSGAAGLTPGELGSFFDEKAEEGYPAVHHSEEYSRAHAPAYRVVLSDLVD